ncbi:MAG: hypothetical protein ACP6IY_13300 [Promethearchaeia archaeon]
MIVQLLGTLDIAESLRPLGEYAGFFLGILGVFWFIFAAYEANRRKSWRKLTKIDDWDFDITKFLKILTFGGFIVGILAIIIGAVGLILNVPPSIAYYSQTKTEEVHVFTSVFLIILGILTFLKPMNDLPIASIAGILVASTVCVLLFMLIPDKAVTFIAEYINPKVLLISIFLIIFAIVAITVKFYIEGLMILSKIISWPPFAIIIGIICFAQSFALVVLGTSIF